MASPSLLDRVLAALFGGETKDGDEELVAELTDLIVDTVEPKVRAHRHYRRELKGCVRATIAYLRALGRMPLQTVLLSRDNWNVDPLLNSFFGAADDVPAFLQRCNDLRAYFEGHAGLDEAYGLLGMKKQERTVFGPKWEDGLLKQDVAQTTVNFVQHRLVALAASEAEARLEVGKRIVLRLAQVALAQIVELDSKGLQHEQQKAYLGTRLRLLRLARDGMEGIVEDPSTIRSQIAAVEADLAREVKGFIEAKSSLATLDGYIELIRGVFEHPEQHVALTRQQLRVNRMNVKVEEDPDEAQNALTLAELRVGERLQAVIAFVRCPRAEQPAKLDLLSKAERYL